MGKCFLIITIFLLFISCGYQKAKLEKYEHWDCVNYRPCKFTGGAVQGLVNKCPQGQHDENGNCVLNTRECNNKIQNGTGTETWTNGWGFCKVNGCDSGFAINGNTCVKQSLKCKSEEHEENGKCISNTRECKVLNGKAEENWINIAWNKCRVKSCNFGFKQNDNQCIATNFPDIKSCKAASYNSEAKTELKLTDKNWCGGKKGRFKLENKGNDFIYDAMLKGYWSKQNNKDVSWEDAKSHCSGLGNGYALPNIYKVLSLISETEDASEGTINPIFSDTDKKWFWSITLRTASSSQAWRVRFSFGSLHYNSVNANVRVRCFRPE